MKLSSINLYRNWDKSKPGYHGKMKFEANNGSEIELKFEDEFGQQILLMVADRLVGEAKKLAEELTAECIGVKQNG
jgi:hypothetical protein